MTKHLAQWWEDLKSASNDWSRPTSIALPESSGLYAEDVMALNDAVIRSRELSLNIDGVRVSTMGFPADLPVDKADYSRFARELLTINRANACTYTRDFCLSSSPKLSHALMDFVTPCADKYGVPAKGINAVLIGGAYSETWIGLHNDFCRTLLIPFVGRKSLMLWEPSYFDGRLTETGPSANGRCFGPVDVHPYADDALTVTAAEGEVLFIPETWWHYNKLATAEPTLSLSIGMFSGLDEQGDGAFTLERRLTPGTYRPSPDVDEETSEAVTKLVNKIVLHSTGGVIGAFSREADAETGTPEQLAHMPTSYLIPLGEGVAFVVSSGQVDLVRGVQESHASADSAEHETTEPK